VASHGNQKYVNSIVAFLTKTFDLQFVSVAYRDDKIKTEKEKPKTFDGPCPLILDDRPCVWEERYLQFVKEVPQLRYETADSDFVLLEFILIALQQSQTVQEKTRMVSLLWALPYQIACEIVTFLPQREQFQFWIEEDVSKHLQDLDEAERPFTLIQCLSCQQVVRGKLTTDRFCLDCVLQLSSDRHTGPLTTFLPAVGLPQSTLAPSTTSLSSAYSKAMVISSSSPPNFLPPPSKKRQITSKNDGDHEMQSSDT